MFNWRLEVKESLQQFVADLQRLAMFMNQRRPGLRGAADYVGDLCFEETAFNRLFRNSYARKKPFGPN